MNLSALLVDDGVPPLTVTVTSTVPALSAGLVAMQLVAELHVTAVPAVVPKSTVSSDEVVEKPVPVMVTTVPPASGPEVGLIAVTVGADAAAAVPTNAPTRRPVDRTRAPAS